MIRIFLVSDSIERSDAMAQLLEEDDRFEITEIDRADVILCVGISIRRLPRRGTPLVAVSSEKDADAAFDDTLKAWLPSSATLDEIAAALIAAARGFTVLTSGQVKRAFRNLEPELDDFESEHLTDREHEVLQMLAAGLGNKEIAARLNISPNTAKFHVTQILAKLRAASRTEAVSLAIRRGLVAI